jgi:hypothetical protein
MPMLKTINEIFVGIYISNLTCHQVLIIFNFIGNFIILLCGLTFSFLLGSPLRMLFLSADLSAFHCVFLSLLFVKIPSQPKNRTTTT